MYRLTWSPVTQGISVRQIFWHKMMSRMIRFWFFWNFKILFHTCTDTYLTLHLGCFVWIYCIFCILYYFLSVRIFLLISAEPRSLYLHISKPRGELSFSDVTIMDLNGIIVGSRVMLATIDFHFQESMLRPVVRKVTLLGICFKNMF